MENFVTPDVLISENEIALRVDDLAHAINNDFKVRSSLLYVS